MTTHAGKGRLITAASLVSGHSVGRRWQIAAMMVWTLAACDSESASYPQLHLTRDTTISWPAHFDPAGASASLDGTILVWDAEIPQVALLDGSGRWELVELPMHVPPMRMWWSQGDSAWKALSGDLKTVVSLDRELHYRAEQDVGRWMDRLVPFDVLGGQHFYAVAYTSGEDATLRVGVTTTLAEPPREIGAVRPSEMLPDDHARVGGHLTVAEGDVFLNLLWAPFDIYQLTTTTLQRRVQVHKQIQDAELIPREVRVSLLINAWGALPLVPIEGGWLMTMSELSSDRRLHLRISQDGELISATVAERPAAFLAAIDAGRRIVMVERYVEGAQIQLFSGVWTLP